MKKGLFFGIMVLIFCGNVFAQESEVEPVQVDPVDWGIEYQRGVVKVGIWSASYTGDIKYVEDVEGVRIGETLDIVDDLEFENPVNSFEAELEVKASRRNRFHASLFQCEYSGHVSEVTGDDVYELGGEEFDVDIDTSADLSRIHLGYEFLPVATPRGDFSIMLGIDYYNLGFAVESKEPDAKVEESHYLGIPVAGLRGRYTIGYGIGVYGGIHGIGFSVEDADASYTDVEAGLTFKYKRLFASAGYRSIGWHLEVGEDEEDEDYGRLNLVHDGALVKLGVNF
jgi:hypothetical protein